MFFSALSKPWGLPDDTELDRRDASKPLAPDRALGSDMVGSTGATRAEHRERVHRSLGALGPDLPASHPGCPGRIDGLPDGGRGGGAGVSAQSQ